MTTTTTDPNENKPTTATEVHGVAQRGLDWLSLAGLGVAWRTYSAGGERAA